MVRKNDKTEFRRIPCYWYSGNMPKKLFYAQVQETQNVTTEIGQQMSNGFKTLHTYSDYNFKVNDQVEVMGDKKLMIRDIGQTIIEEDNNGLRGKPRYAKTLLIR